MASLILTGIFLIFVQVLFALPWLLTLIDEILRFRSVGAGDKGSPPRSTDPSRRLWHWLKSRQGLNAVLILLATIVVVGSLLGLVLTAMGDPESLQSWGRRYASVLQLQLYADLFVLAIFLLQWLWPKGASVALAAFREGYRQPTFWLIALVGFMLMSITPFLPYFTFGEDYLVVKELGYDAVMLCAVLFGVLAAGTSISDEIEGRTAITVMSKPISRRQFLLGKYVGIVLASLILVVVIGWYFQWILVYKRWFDALPADTLGPAANNKLAATFSSIAVRELVNGMLLWGVQITEVLPGLVKTTSMVMVLVAISVTLATRFPMVVNLVTCLMIYFMANLMPILVQVTSPAAGGDVDTARQLLYFMAQLFDTLLPGLELLRVNPTLVGVSAVHLDDYLQHVGYVALYGLMYTALVLLIGLTLFEDRDLA